MAISSLGQLYRSYAAVQEANAAAATSELAKGLYRQSATRWIEWAELAERGPAGKSV